MEPAIEVKDLSYRYPGGASALEDVSMQAMRGEIVAVIGPNGAGKSTLLLHMARVLGGGEGITLKGADLRDKKKSDLVRELGIVFQHPDDQLFMPTVEDDVAFGPLNMGLPAEEVKRRVADALSKVGLSGYEQRFPHGLSFGEKKKAALATVLSMDSEIILLDEPTANLDPKSRRDLIRILKKLKEEGKTIVFSTHDVAVVPELADVVYVLDKKMISFGPPRKIFSDIELLRKANLEVPAIAYLFEVLTCFGYDCEQLPLSMDEAVDHLTAALGTSGGHIHLHLHEHTHSELEKLKDRHGHH